jgi:hypothetical protein
LPSFLSGGSPNGVIAKLKQLASLKPGFRSSQISKQSIRATLESSQAFIQLKAKIKAIIGEIGGTSTTSTSIDSDVFANNQRFGKFYTSWNLIKQSHPHFHRVIPLFLEGSPDFRHNQGVVLQEILLVWEDLLSGQIHLEGGDCYSFALLTGAHVSVFLLLICVVLLNP